MLSTHDCLADSMTDSSASVLQYSLRSSALGRKIAPKVLMQRGNIQASLHMVNALRAYSELHATNVLAVS